MKWVSVEDRLPDKPGTYLCHFDDGETETFPLNEDEFDGYGNVTIKWGVLGYGWVTHWMPLPEPPDA